MSKKTNLSFFISLSTFSIALLPIVPNAINSICLIAWAFLMLLNYFLKRKGSGFASPIITRPGNKPIFFLIAGNFILLALSLVYSIAPAKGVDFLVAELPMLLFPFCFFFTGPPFPDMKGLLTKVFIIFWASTCLMTIWIFYHYWQQNLFGEFSRASSFNTIFRQVAEQCTDKHPDYISIYLVFSIYLAADRLMTVRSLSSKLLYGVSIPVMIFLLALLAERSPILALIVGTVVLCFLRIKKRALRWTVMLSLLASFLLIVRYTPAIWSRIIETRDTPLETPVGVHHNSTNIRVGIYKCSWELIRKNMFFGVGAGSDRPLLEACYTQFPTDAYRITYYNTHNQYINFWLLGGIFSLLLFLGSIGYAVVLSLRRKDHTLLFFMILMSISFLSENVLSRQAGVVFYYFFISLIIYCRLTDTGLKAIPGNKP